MAMMAGGRLPGSPPDVPSGMRPARTAIEASWVKSPVLARTKHHCGTAIRSPWLRRVPPVTISQPAGRALVRMLGSMEAACRTTLTPTLSVLSISRMVSTHALGPVNRSKVEAMRPMEPSELSDNVTKDSGSHDSKQVTMSVRGHEAQASSWCDWS